MSRRPKPHHHSGTKRIEPLFPVSGTCPMLRTTHFYFTSVRQMGGVEVDQPAFSDPQRQNCNLKKITKSLLIHVQSTVTNTQKGISSRPFTLWFISTSSLFLSHHILPRTATSTRAYPSPAVCANQLFYRPLGGA